eukprot:m.331132 g.331132  ORF g.331132 m.331132 type:complete len:51 (-) comp20471_c0_seq3:208-360(-)
MSASVMQNTPMNALDTPNVNMMYYAFGLNVQHAGNRGSTEDVELSVSTMV